MAITQNMNCKPAAIRGCTWDVCLVEFLDLLHSESLELFNLLLSDCEIVPEPALLLVNSQTAYVLSDRLNGVQITACTITRQPGYIFVGQSARTSVSVSAPSAYQTHPTSCDIAAAWQQ